VDTQYQVTTEREGMTPVPLASMALETFKNNSYSIQTDIWSYGILLWEMFSFGSDPLNGYPKGPDEVIYIFLNIGQG
jgi:serine/threonine protein kinase